MPVLLAGAGGTSLQAKEGSKPSSAARTRSARSRPRRRGSARAVPPAWPATSMLRLPASAPTSWPGRARSSTEAEAKHSQELNDAGCCATASPAPAHRPESRSRTDRPVRCADEFRQASQIDAQSKPTRRPTGRGRPWTRRTCSGCMSCRSSVVAVVPRRAMPRLLGNHDQLRHTLRRPRTTPPVPVKLVVSARREDVSSRAARDPRTTHVNAGQVNSQTDHGHDVSIRVRRRRVEERSDAATAQYSEGRKIATAARAGPRDVKPRSRGRIRRQGVRRDGGTKAERARYLVVAEGVEACVPSGLTVK